MLYKNVLALNAILSLAAAVPQQRHQHQQLHREWPTRGWSSIYRWPGSSPPSGGWSQPWEGFPHPADEQDPHAGHAHDGAGRRPSAPPHRQRPAEHHSSNVQSAPAEHTSVVQPQPTVQAPSTAQAPPETSPSPPSAVHQHAPAGTGHHEQHQPTTPAAPPATPQPTTAAAAPPTTTTVAAAPPTTTTAAAATPSPSSGSTTPSGQKYSGDITYYAPGLGSCGITNGPTDMIVALAEDMMLPEDGSNPNDNPLCGRSITISYGGKTAVAQIEDTCPGCSGASLDMTPSLFEIFAPLATGRVSGVEWWFN